MKRFLSSLPGAHRFRGRVRQRRHSHHTGGRHPSQFKATLLPANEVPAIAGAEAAGSGVATIDFTLMKDAAGAITAGTVNFRVDVTGFPATTAITGAHIHPGAAGVTGGVLVERGTSAGEVVLTNGAVTFSRLNIAMKAADGARRSSTTRRATTSTFTRRRTRAVSCAVSSSSNKGRQTTGMRTHKSMFRVAAGTAVAITLASMVLASEVTNPVPSTAKSIETGRQLFQKYCKACHGEDATGNGPHGAEGRPSSEPDRRRVEIRRHRRRDLHEHSRRHRSEVRHEIVEEPDDRRRDLERRQLPSQHRGEIRPAVSHTLSASSRR